ncbi:MAG: hypothetical protein ACRC45_05175 [Cetobacterium sp.]
MVNLNSYQTIKKREVSFMKKILCTALLLTISIGSLLTVGAKASTTYGSSVYSSALSTCGYAWTDSSGDSCRARIIIMGQKSDKTLPSWVQTEQVTGAGWNYAYMNYYTNGNLIASETK